MIYDICKECKNSYQQKQTLLPEDKAKDIQIFKLLKTNQAASLGPFDRKKLKYML